MDPQCIYSERGNGAQEVVIQVGGVRVANTPRLLDALDPARFKISEWI